jgi:hypothetical protein
MQLPVRQATLDVVFNKTDAWCRLTAVRDGNALHTHGILFTEVKFGTLAQTVTFPTSTCEAS